jgi:5-methylcytosine-specific restriction endonuclease McrA
VEREIVAYLRERAGHCCEYCRLPEFCSELPFHLDHVISRQHGGGTSLDNLALTCCYCNRYKGPNLTGVDPESGQIVPLFHPRKQTWEVHFSWEGPYLSGRTPIGRATVRVLQINRPAAVALRDLLMKEGAFVHRPMMVHEPGVEMPLGV